MVATIAGYMYQADVLCPEDTRKRLGYGPGTAHPHDDLTVEERIHSIARRIGIDYYDAYTYDSDDFPKPIFEVELECVEIDGDVRHERCADCGRTLCGAPNVPLS